MKHQEKIVGILGGLGPEATATLFMEIIKATPAKKDQDHLRIIIDNNPKIPNRTLACLAMQHISIIVSYKRVPMYL